VACGRMPHVVLSRTLPRLIGEPSAYVEEQTLDSNMPFVKQILAWFLTAVAMTCTLDTSKPPNLHSIYQFQKYSFMFVCFFVS
jgi:hypothetical protein